MLFIVDTREKKPFSFAKHGHRSTKRKLVVGDYSIHGYTKHIAVERKGFGDYIASLMNGRLERQIKKLSKLYAAMVIVEGHFDHMRHFSRYANPQMVISKTTELMMTSPIPIMFAHKRIYAELFTIQFLVKATKWMKKQ